MQIVQSDRPFQGQVFFPLPPHDLTASVRVNGVNAAISKQSITGITLANPVNSTDVVEVTYNTIGSGISGEIRMLFQKARVVAIGDSITWYGTDELTVGGKPFRGITERSWLDHANALMGQRMNILNRAGVSGERIDQIRARFTRDVVPFRPTLVVLQGGSNDLDQGYSAEQVWQSVMSTYRASRAIGADLLYVGTAGMNRTNAGTGVSPIDGVQYLESQEFAKLLTYARKAARTLPGFMYFDMAAIMRDYTASTGSTSTGAVIPNVLVDSTHPSPYGAYLMGSALATFLTPYMAGVVPDRGTLNGYGSNGDQSSLFGNKLMIGTAGAVTAPNTGSTPDPINITRSGSIVVTGASTVARTDGGPGKQLLLPISGAAATTDYVQLAASGGYSKGAGIAAFFEAGLQVTAATSGNILKTVAELKFLDSGGATLGTVAFGKSHWNATTDDLTGLTGTPDFGLKRTPEMLVPVGTTTVAFTLRIHTTVGAQLTLGVTDLGGLVDTVTPSLNAFM
ncbi:SGNH/GDSL hydrolase family protein [Pseudoduganella lutea]|uniref:SGNH hydrolase-type esterase domain-containing protein n=1 Tax=Pseudoduganella lutea TaxID=321985 RepID=A0A4P6L5D1_9BURK|nr:GDSL-type esterase/lipase family protein [Pseudoduganella lutea]QBE66839.1 hypothetical protein EWM63_30925 [Pseudoduganella lutea]